MSERPMVASKRTMILALVIVGLTVASVVVYVRREITSPSGTDEAVWTINPFEPPPRDGSTFRALVTGLSCNSGVAHQVLPPTIKKTADTVTVTFTVATVTGTKNCQGSPTVPYDVDLGEPIGNRDLVDGDCLSSTSRAATSGHCSEDHGVRLAADDHFAYVLMFRDCATPGSASRLAAELHLDTAAPAAVAEADALRFPTATQQDARQGCLDALEGRAQKYEH